MAENSNTPGPATVTDRRSIPSGVLPRGAQTWLMVGIAGVMLLIMFVAGRPEPPRSRPPAAAAPVAPAPDRLRDYQERLRVMEARATQDARATVAQPSAAPTLAPEPPRPSSEDSVAADRRRRNYESLFASNVVLSRRPDAERPDGTRSIAPRSTAPGLGAAAPSATPSIDDVAEAVVRATARATGGLAAVQHPPAALQPPQPAAGDQPRNAKETEPIRPSAPIQRLLEGTFIDAVLTNRLDGGAAGPVNCLVTNPVYSHSGRQILIPAGARILGETKPVQSFGETRLAVAFHRLVMPDGSTHTLDHPPALNQIGDAGLHDQVNQHYVSTFGAAAAVGLISGLAQFVGTAGFSGDGGNRTVIIAGPADASAQASMQVMNRLLNRLPSITIREGHRIKVYLTGDLELPPYNAGTDR
jgi:type IV secretory pathway VirB10-like protein